MKITTFNLTKNWLDLIVISVISISIISITLLVFDSFNPKTAVLLGLAISVTIFSLTDLHKDATTVNNSVNVAVTAVIIFLALIFRIDFYPSINGGQDQGVYVSMSSYIQHEGSIFVKDNILSELQNDELKQIYINNRQEGAHFHPGVYYGGEKDYVFQFYHLHPLWMANTAEFFGDNGRGYSLIFFSILSLIFLMLLTYEISNSRFAALLVGLLIAINPLHIFFSKWPVTEVMALAFSSIGFYYLARAYRFAHLVNVSRWSLAIACLSLSLLFFVRISGFLYLPFLAAIFMIGAWEYKIKKSKFGFDLILFSLACISFYTLSIFYGLKFSPNYSNNIYQIIFGKITGLQWSWIMATGLLVLFASMTSWFYLLGNSAFILKVRNLARPRILIIGLFLLACVAVILSLINVYKLGYSDVYSSDPWLGVRWNLSGSGLQAVERASVINWLIYSSPILILVGLVALLHRRLDFKIVLLILMVSVPLGAFVIQSPVLPYQYYYARYLVSESVPYGIVLSVTALFMGNSKNWRRAGLLAVILTIPFFSYYSIKQFGAEEGLRPLTILRKIALNIDENDILLIESSGWTINRFALETPLRFYFGLKTFALPEKDRLVFSDQIARSYRNIWLLSPKAVNDERYILKQRLLHYDRVSERVGKVPTKIVQDFYRQELFLYELKKPGYPSFNGEVFKINVGPHLVSQNSYEIETLLGNGWHALELEHVWSSELAVINLKKSLFPNGNWPRKIKLDIAPFAASEDRPLSVKVQEGINHYKFDYSSGHRTIIEVPLNCNIKSDYCNLKFIIKDAISPQKLGQSADERILGFALFSISF